MQVTTANAFNFWGVVTGLELNSHFNKFLLLSYQNWGYILFAIFSLPLLYTFSKSKKKETLWWTLALISFSSFIFLTNMHERYLYPLFPPLTLLVAKNKKLLPLYITISLISLLNLYNLWWTPKIDILVQILTTNQKILPRLLSVILTVSYLYLFKYFFKTNSS
jgi:hypothetical protein